MLQRLSSQFVTHGNNACEQLVLLSLPRVISCVSPLLFYADSQRALTFVPNQQLCLSLRPQLALVSPVHCCLVLALLPALGASPALCNGRLSPTTLGSSNSPPPELHDKVPQHTPDTGPAVGCENPVGRDDLDLQLSPCPNQFEEGKDDCFKNRAEHEQPETQLYATEQEEKERQYQEHKLMMERQVKLGSKHSPVKKTFTCRLCHKGFHKRKQYEKHLRTHDPLNQCPHCAFKTRNKKQFESHEMRHLKEKPKFECDLCQGRYATSSLLRGHRGRNHGIFHCYHCSQEFNSFENRNQHMQEVHGVRAAKRKSGLYTGDNYIYEQDDDLEGADLGENVCEICHKQCRSRALLKAHVAQHLNVDTAHLTDDLEPAEKRPRFDETPDESSLDSAEAKVAYTPPRSYKKRSPDVVNDQQAELGSVCEQPRADEDSSFRRRYLNDPQVNLLARIKPASENAIFLCAYCNTHFSNPSALFWHAVTTHGFREFDARRRAAQQTECSSASLASSDNSEERSCDGTAASSESTKERVVEVVGVIAPSRGPLSATRAPYECRICGPGVVFRKSAQYRKHLSTTHKKLRRCGECKFTSSYMMKVIAHQTAHHKHLFRCPSLCLRLFQTREEMLLHKEQQHPAATDAAAGVTASLDQH